MAAIRCECGSSKQFCFGHGPFTATFDNEEERDAWLATMVKDIDKRDRWTHELVGDLDSLAVTLVFHYLAHCRGNMMSDVKTRVRYISKLAWWSQPASIVFHTPWYTEHPCVEVPVKV